MLIWLPLGAIAGFLGWAAIRRLRDGRRDRVAPRNDLLRAGEGAELGPEEAALRAEGQAAWMRPTGL